MMPRNAATEMSSPLPVFLNHASLCQCQKCATPNPHTQTAATSGGSDANGIKPADFGLISDRSQFRRNLYAGFSLQAGSAVAARCKSRVNVPLGVVGGGVRHVPRCW